MGFCFHHRSWSVWFFGLRYNEKILQRSCNTVKIFLTINAIFIKVFCFNLIKAVMTIESADHNLELYPFPSITICNQNKISKSKLDDLLLRNPRYGQFTVEQITFIVSVMLQVHEARNRTSELLKASKMLVSSGITTQDIIDIIHQVFASISIIISNHRLIFNDFYSGNNFL